MLKPLEVVANGQGECQQFFQGLLRVLEVNSDPARLKPHACR